MKKIISFCLWGNNPDYTIGAVRNAEIAPDIYPGWVCRFYCDSTVPKNIISKLEFISEVIKLDRPFVGVEGTFYRMSPILADQDEIVIYRDTDSRLSLREKEIVDQWLKSDKDIHIIRDHPAHVWPIMAGMWGCKSKHLFSFDEWQKAPKDSYFDDQKFLAKVAQKIDITKVLVHTSIPSIGIPIPNIKPVYGSFIGQRITWDDKVGRE